MKTKLVAEKIFVDGDCYVKIKEVEVFDAFEELEESYSYWSVNEIKKGNVEAQPSSRFDEKKIIPFIQKLEKEVAPLPRKKKKKYLTALKASLIGLMPFLMTPKADASMITTLDELVKQENRDGLGLLPQELLQLILDVIKDSALIGILLAAILLIAAGALFMFRQSDKATKWTSEIIRGLGQILIAPTLVIFLVALVSLILGGFSFLEKFF